MRSLVKLGFICLILSCFFCSAVWSVRVMGTVTSVDAKSITCTFPAIVEPNSMIMVLSGDGESIAATAVACKCTGIGPYSVTANILFVGDSLNLIAGKAAYVNSLNTRPAPSRIPVAFPRSNPPANDLKLYYYAAGQTVGYGTLGLGYERTLRASRGLALEVDGSAATVGSINGDDPKVINTDQLILSANGRVRFDFSDFGGFYTAYRWSQGRGNEEHWSELVDSLAGKTFIGPSQFDDQTVMMQGLEYGMTIRPWRNLALSAGYIPSYRADYGMFGVRTQPGYTGELRFGTKHGALRIRGIKSDDYWQADFGITIR